MPHQTTPFDPTTLNRLWHDLDTAERLASLRQAVPGRLVFTTSFGAEDQVLTHVIAESGLAIELVTLDTGRLFPETYDVWEATERRYGLRIAAFTPEPGAVAGFVGSNGINGFRNSPEARQACCAARKVAPLRQALLGAAGWVTGLRADQSAHRRDVALVGFDAGFGLVKANPLCDWTRGEIGAFLIRHDIPANVLHARGFVSIGCAPCTRAIAPGEPERAGRWWWEQESARECGLHVSADGRLSRISEAVG